MEANALYGAAPRSGKTEHCRAQLLTYLLDRRALIYGMDGKGSRSDYARVARMAEVWVWGTDEDAPRQTVRMLEQVVRLVQHRNESDATGHEDWPPVLLMLEELQDVRAAASTTEGDAIDDALSRIVRMGGAPRVKMVISTQRTSVDDLPSAVRNLLNNLHAGWIANKADYKLVLGESPTVPTDMPRKGEWIGRTADGQVRYLSDRIPPAEWQVALDRAEKLRARIHRPPVVPEQREPVDAVLAQVLLACRAEPQRASVLVGELDDWTGTARDLGIHLRQFPEHVVRESYKGRDCWHLTTLGRTLADTLAARRSTPWHQGQNALIGAST